MMVGATYIAVLLNCVIVIMYPRHPGMHIAIDS